MRFISDRNCKYGLYPISEFVAEVHQRRCADPDCKKEKHDVIYFTQGCHEDAAQLVKYDKQTDILTVECAECGRGIVAIDFSNGGANVRH